MSALIVGTIYVASQVYSVMEQKEANYQRRVAAGQQYEAQKRQFEAEQKRADIQNIRGQREQIRAARIAQAQMQNTAAQTGGMGSSALSGGLSSVSSQLSGSLNYTAQIAEQNTAIIGAQMDQASAQLAGASVTSNAAVWGAIGDIAGTIFTGGGGFKKIMS
jgi:hypothetical protein